MRTPKEYTKNLNEHIITKDMLLDCLYSSNKRAKNWRDREREYRNRCYDKYHNEEKARGEKEYYYSQKETMLSIIKPVCIHRENIERKSRCRIYEYEDEYWQYKCQDEFVYEDGYWDRELQEYVEFGDIYVKETVYHYYLFYDLGGTHTFHTPIEEESVEKYGLEVVDIDQLFTKGYDIAELISTQFVKKLITLIKSEDYTLVVA